MLQCCQQLPYISPGGPRGPWGHEEGGQCSKPCPGCVCCHGRQRGHRQHRYSSPLHPPLIPLLPPPSSHLPPTHFHPSPCPLPLFQPLIHLLPLSIFFSPSVLSPILTHFLPFHPSLSPFVLLLSLQPPFVPSLCLQCCHAYVLIVLFNRCPAVCMCFVGYVRLSQASLLSRCE